MGTRKMNNQYFYEKAIEAIVGAGFAQAGETPQQIYRTGSASNPIYGGMGGKLCTVGGRQRFAKPDTMLRVTVGKVSTCFYEVEDNKARNHVTMSTRDTDRIKRWASSQICFHRTDAIRLGREDEWLRLNAPIIGNKCPSCDRMFIDGETCSRGGCPMGGDV